MVQASAEDWKGVGHRMKLYFIQKLERTRRDMSAAGMVSKK